MWMMKAPATYFSEGKSVSGTAYTLPIINGYILGDKQYWHKFLQDRGFKDVTPQELQAVEPHKQDKMLVIRWGGYGDIIMCLPPITYLKEKNKDLRVVIAGMDKHAAVLKDHPAVDAIYLPPAHQIGNMVGEYDLAFDLSGIIPCNPVADRVNAYDLHFSWFGIDADEVPVEEKVPDIIVKPGEVTALNKALIAKGINEDDFILVFNAKSSTEMRDLPFNIARDAIITLALKHPGMKIIVSEMQGAIRNNERFICNKCKTEQVISIKKAVEYTPPIKHTCPECDALINLVPPDFTGKVRGQKIVWHVLPENVHFPKLDFRLFCALLYRSNMVITVDSAPLHIAGGLDTPTLGLFSSFDGDLRARYFPNTTWIQQPFRCAPCFMHNRICPRFQSEKRLFSPCMDSIQAELIVNKAEELLEAVKVGEAVRAREGEKDEPLRLELTKPAPFPIPEKEGVTCFACTSTEVELGFRKGSHFYWKCSTCGSYFIYPRPTVEYLAESYQDADYNIVFAAMSGIKKVAQIITVMLGQMFDFQGKLLEIGSSIGWFAEEAKRLGWDVTGVEVSKASVAECRKRGLAEEIICGSIEDGDTFARVQRKGPFDAIIIHNTLEHCIDPVSLLQACSSIAGPDTIFSISTPCMDVWDGKNTWGHINPFFAGEHVNLLSKKGMKHLCARAGLKITKTEDFLGSDECWYVIEKDK